MKTKLRYANKRTNLKLKKSLHKKVNKAKRKPKIVHSPETKSVKVGKNKVIGRAKYASQKKEEMLVVGQGSDQIHVCTTQQMNIIDLNHKIEKRLKIFSPCSATGSKTDKSESSRSLEARFKILSPHLKGGAGRLKEGRYVAYDMDDKVAVMYLF